MSCLIATKTSAGVNYTMTRLDPGHELPPFRELAAKRWEHADPGTEDQLYLQQDGAGQTPMTNFKMTVRVDSAVLHVAPFLCLCAALKLSFNSPCLLISKEEFVF